MKPKPGPSAEMIAYRERLLAIKSGLPVEPVAVIEKPKRVNPADDVTANKCHQCGKRDRFCWDINGELKCKKCSREYFTELERKARAK